MPAVTEWHPLDPGVERPAQFPADLPFIPGLAGSYGSTPTGACCRWLIPVSPTEAARQRDAVAAAGADAKAYIEALPVSEGSARIAAAATTVLAENALQVGWTAVPAGDQTGWPGMVERRGFTRGGRYLEIWAMMFGPEPHVMVMTGPQEESPA